MNKHPRWANLVGRKSARPQLRTSIEGIGARFGPASPSARSREWAAALRPAASDQHQLRPDRGNRLQRPGFRLAFGPCRRDRRPLRPGIVFGPMRRLRLAHAAPPARAPPSAQHEGGLLRRQGLRPNASQPARPLRPNAMAACFGAKFASSQTEPSEQQVLQTQKC